MCNALAAVVATALALSATARATTITVDSLADTGVSGTCILRDAITAANTMTATNGCTAGTGNDTIDFTVTGTIMLGSSLPGVSDRFLTINGPPSPGITIDGGGTVRVMQVASGATLNLSNLTISDGLSAEDDGGGILNNGTLTVTNSTFSSNQSVDDYGGAIYNGGTLTVTNSTFSGNSAGGGGGAIENGGANFTDGTLIVINSTFSGNGAAGGGAIGNGGTLTVTNSTFSGNEADFGGGAINNSAGSVHLKSTLLAASVGITGGAGSNCVSVATGGIIDAGITSPMTRRVISAPPAALTTLIRCLTLMASGKTAARHRPSPC
jgi:predicted outer membrane repeat protein